MRIFVSTSHPSSGNIALEKFLDLLSRFPAPAINGNAWTLDAQQADAVLLVDDHYLSIRGFLEFRRSELFRRFAGRCFLYSNTDWPAPYWPGIFPALTPATSVRGRTVSAHYISPHTAQIPHSYVEATRRDWLYSFVGRARTAPVRERLMQLTDARGLCRSTEAAPHQTDLGANYRDDYFSTLSRSQFVLCPRGLGSGSMRLFEAMQCGRVPVIISDGWIAPQGPDWPSFSLRIAESDVPSIPQRLAALEPQAQAMGQRARAAWLRWFSDEQTPATILQYLGTLIAERNGTPRERLADAYWSARFMLAPRQLKSLAFEAVLGPLGIRPRKL